MTGNIRFDRRTVLPTLSAVLALLVHLLVPDSPGYTSRPMPYFTIVLITVTGISLLLAVLSLFFPAVRENMPISPCS